VYYHHDKTWLVFDETGADQPWLRGNEDRNITRNIKVGHKRRVLCDASFTQVQRDQCRGHDASPL
jgi:hypothetical protein